MRGHTARLGKGFFRPRCIPDQGELSRPPVEPPEQGISLPMHPGPGWRNSRSRGLRIIPSKEPSRSLETHRPLFGSGFDQRAFMPLGTLTKEPQSLRCLPFGNQTGESEPRPPAGISRLQPTKAVPWNPSLPEGGWREELTSGSGRA